MEPYKLRRWKPKAESLSGQLYTCARPGRSKDKDAIVPDYLIYQWLDGLPGDGALTIISLLGSKSGTKGASEFDFYPFFGAWDTQEERHGKVSFQEWLNKRYKRRAIHVIEHPTYDFQRVPITTLQAVALDIGTLLSRGETVVIVDSGGVTRTEAVVRRHMNFIEDPTTNR